MSQNKTVFPGLSPEGDYNPRQGQGAARANQAFSNSPRNNRMKGTVVPGMENNSNAQQSAPRIQNRSFSTRTGKPIVGFLYSISRTGMGEYWPLHVGQNIIGNSAECDIVLGEGTVSAKHANLHINKMKKPEKTEATLSELGSSNGTLVNENSVSMARPVECFNGDVITVGENYDLLLVLIDSKEHGLHLSENFIDVRDDDNFVDSFEPAENPVGAGNATRNQHDFPPRFDPTSSIHPTAYSEGYRHTDSTVGLDSNDSGFHGGGTVGMD